MNIKFDFRFSCVGQNLSIFLSKISPTQFSFFYCSKLRSENQMTFGQFFDFETINI
jgi:hypothetical protein